MRQHGLCVFGEVLFDHFPDDRQVLGGAPFNVAWHLQAFGQAPHFISRIGDDEQGHAVREAMQTWGMDLSGLQVDPALPTGRVDITFVDGEPHYDIVRPCAYDAIAAGAPPGDCRLLYHGSLALREETSAGALRHLKQAVRPETVFIDVNLRPPWWQRDQVVSMLHEADWVKLNADELSQLHPSRHVGTPAPGDFLNAFKLRGLIVTHGADGAEILTDQGDRYAARPEHNVTVVDTVGAGDAFASVIILGLALGWPLELTLVRAQGFSSQLVGKRGATVSDPAFYQTFIEQWKLAV